MTLLGWFDAKAARECGAALAREFIARVPPDDSKPDSRKFEARAKSAIGAMQKRAAAFAAEHKLNAYKKARLCNAFKWTLKDAGYADAYVDKLTDLLLLQL